MEFSLLPVVILAAIVLVLFLQEAIHVALIALGACIWFMLAIVAWIVFFATCVSIPRDPFASELESSSFLLEYLGIGRPLYERNLAWRRNIAKYRAMLRETT